MPQPYGRPATTATAGDDRDDKEDPEHTQEP
jgi:hypothetical protein